MEELNNVCAKWKKIGLQLGVSVGELNAIKKQYNDPSDCLEETLTTWLTNYSHPPMWTNIIVALRSSTVGEARLAADLEHEYYSTQGTSAATTHHHAPPVSDVPASQAPIRMTPSPQFLVPPTQPPVFVTPYFAPPQIHPPSHLPPWPASFYYPPPTSYPMSTPFLPPTTSVPALPTIPQLPTSEAVQTVTIPQNPVQPAVAAGM